MITIINHAFVVILIAAVLFAGGTILVLLMIGAYQVLSELIKKEE